MSTDGPYEALLLVSFGAPEGPADVAPFLANVTRGRGVPADRLAEVAGHYQQVGGVSPLNAANRALLAALRDRLAPLPVYWGNRNWHPFLADTVAQMAGAGVRRALAFVTSAFGSYSGCRQYLEDLDAARASVGPTAPVIDKLRLFYDHPLFLDIMADRVRAGLARFGAQEDPAVLSCAHSVPCSMAATGPYTAQLAATSRLLAERIGRPVEQVWQSRSGPPAVPWLEPDVGDRIEALAAAGTRAVLAVPLGFVSDHMEVRYDLDTEAAARARAVGVHFERAGTAGSDPRFTAMVAELVAERTAGAPARALLAAAGIPGCAAAAGACCRAPARPVTPGPGRRSPR